MNLSDLDPDAVVQAFDENKITLSDLIGRLDEISRTAVKPTKDGGVVDDGATQLRATEDLIDLLQVKLGMKVAQLKRAKVAPQGLAQAMDKAKAIEAEVVPREKDRLVEKPDASS